MTSKQIFARRRVMKLGLASAGLASAGVALAGCSAPQSKDFYHGKTVHIVIGYEPGGGYDSFARIVAFHLGKHIPGNPTVVAENMPGASSMTATGYIYKVAAQDGTMVAATGLSPLLQPLVDPKTATLDPRKLSWLPSSGQGLTLMMVRSDLPIKSWKDLQTMEVHLAGSGALGQNTLFTHVINYTLHTKIKLIHGFLGTAAEMLAIERGEVQGHPGFMWSSLKTMRPEWVRDKKVTILLQYGGMTPAPDLPNVPFARDLITDPHDKLLFDTGVASLQIVRPFFMGPGVPADRLAIMRKAFMDTYNDPDFLADAKKLQIDIMPQDGASVQAFIEKTYSAPPDIIAKLRELYALPES
jgi:tripartite-type tricarboxylate transporter receptor subunit TctC